MSGTFLDLVYDGAPRAAFDEVVAHAERAGTTGAALAELRRQREVALRLRELITRQRAREAELSALYETARDLTAIRDLDAVLAAIVRRARQLLSADMTYLSLNDEAEGASYMRVTDGALTPEFARLRLPLGTGLLGLVAQTGAPYFTEDYQSDQRFVHRRYIDEAVAGEQIRAILGVPLVVEGRVIGALLAVHRTVRRFPAEEVQLLTSFAAHAAVALENARLFAELDEANRAVTEHAASVEKAARAHDQLTDVLLHGGGVSEVARVLTDVLGAPVSVHDAAGAGLAGGDGGPAALTPDLLAAAAESAASGRTVGAAGAHVAAALAGAEHLATVVLHGGASLERAERRTLERGALVTALVLLFARSVAQTEERLGGELLADLLEGSGQPQALRERARRHGVVLDGPLAVVVATAERVDRHVLRRLARAAAGEHGLVGEHRGSLVLLVPGGEPLARGERVRDLVSELGGTATVGVAAVDGSVPAAYAEAARCRDVLLTLGRAGEVSDPAGLGLARLLLAGSGTQEVEEFVDRVLGPVLGWDAERGTALVATVEAWFDTGGHLRRTAERLHVHPNTVVQRLERVAGLLGGDWRSPSRALDVQLALRVLRLRGLA